MIKFFGNIKIRAKLLLAFGSIILLSVLLTLYAINSIGTIISLQNLNRESENLSINIERIELAAKEFIYETYKQKSFQEKGESETLNRYNAALSAVNESFKTLNESKFLKENKISKVVDSLFKSTAVSSRFAETVDLLKKRGFKDYGLEGLLREAIHKIEGSNQKYDRVAMLTLRRHEKDFFLRKDLKYQTEFNKSIAVFNSELEKEKNQELLPLLSNYQNEFNQVVEIEKQIGLTDQSGKKGELFSKLQEARIAISGVQQEIKENDRK
ncbi:MAG: hypothetical protein QM734_05365 [Cyclobacteriaceae bacterium]